MADNAREVLRPTGHEELLDLVESLQSRIYELEDAIAELKELSDD